ncbi:hypothetical protein BDD12DRAFT_82035 [Trichophaea hybrida]|nr:hypothetical protein BDD12DRAFT_82035 [Trichophaea hybrida]
MRRHVFSVFSLPFTRPTLLVILCSSLLTCLPGREAWKSGRASVYSKLCADQSPTLRLTPNLTRLTLNLTTTTLPHVRLTTC